MDKYMEYGSPSAKGGRQEASPHAHTNTYIYLLFVCLFKCTVPVNCGKEHQTLQISVRDIGIGVIHSRRGRGRKEKVKLLFFLDKLVWQKLSVPPPPPRRRQRIRVSLSNSENRNKGKKLKKPYLSVGEFSLQILMNGSQQHGFSERG